MRIVVMSDSHYRPNFLMEIIERHKDNADLFLFLGDGNTDLDDALMIYPYINIDRVSGNCDLTSPYPATKEIEFAGKKILFTHGHPFYVKHGYQDIQRQAKLDKIDICLFGHTHIPYVEKIDGIYYMNPGSVRDCSYGIIDIEPTGIVAYNQTI